MRYFIDGYNVTRQDPATRDLSLDEQRAALEARLKAFATRLLGSRDYVIVWDGAQGSTKGFTYAKSGASSQFTRKPTADDAIVAKVKSARERVGVVTSDRELTRRCQSAASFGVDVLPSSRLFEQTRQTRKDKKRPAMIRSVGIPANANEINRELKALWGIED